MKRIKVDNYELELVINGMYQMRNICPAERKSQVDKTILSLLDICDEMKPGRKKRIRFETGTLSIICRCLIDWRNDKLRHGELNAVEVINEALILFAA